MKREAFTLRKLKRLCALLKLPHYAGVGILESLWQVTARDAPAGDIGRLTDEEIANEIDWRGVPEKLIEALCDPGCTWLDRHDEHRLLVHDWPDHADDTVHRRLARSGQHFADGSLPKLTKLTQAEREAAEGAFLRGRGVSRVSISPGGGPVGAQRAPEVPPVGENISPGGREPCLALPYQALPTASVGEGEEQSGKRPETFESVEPYARAMVELYPDRPGERGPESVDAVKVTAALERVAHHLPPLREFVGRLLLWRLSDDWTKENGRYIPPADRWVTKKCFKLVPRDRSAPTIYAATWHQTLERVITAAMHPEAMSA
jgi:hypothetical protein